MGARAWVVDALIALGLAALALVAFFGGATDVGPPDGITVALLLLETLPLAVRRRWPLAVFVVVTGSTLLHILAIPAGGELRSGIGVLVAIYTLAERLDRRISITATVVLSVVVAALLLQRDELAATLQGLIQTELVFGVAWLVGDAARIRRLYALAQSRERDEEARRAVAIERQRIARELHDAVTHHVSVAVIQAGGALRALDERPEDVRRALTAIDATSRQALIDMRRMVGILGEADSQAPLPRLDRLGELIEQVRAAGLGVELTIQGEPRELDPGLELSAYRIIQEALTNSLKHAGNGRAHVTVRYEPAALRISVDDQRGSGSGPAVEGAHAGRGLIGMRERVAMFGGALSAEPTATGFRVEARLPLGEGAPS